MRAVLARGVACASLLTFAYASPVAAEAEPPVATVNGEAIGSGELQLMVGTILNQRKPERRSDIDLAQIEAREKLIAELAQAQAAVQLGLDKDPGVAGVLAYQRMGTLARAYQKAMLRQNPVTDERVLEEYQRGLIGGKVHEFKLAHVVVSQKARAEEVIAKLRAGEKFEDLARVYSLDPNVTQNNGELGWMRIDILDEYVFVDAVRALKPGEYSGQPVKGATGWHVLKLLEAPRAMSGAPAFDALPKERHEKLRARAAARQLAAIETQAVNSARVTRAADLRVFGAVESAVTSPQTRPAPAPAP